MENTENIASDSPNIQNLADKISKLEKKVKTCRWLTLGTLAFVIVSVLILSVFILSKLKAEKEIDDLTELNENIYHVIDKEYEWTRNCSNDARLTLYKIRYDTGYKPEIDIDCSEKESAGDIIGKYYHIAAHPELYEGQVLSVKGRFLWDLVENCRALEVEGIGSDVVPHSRIPFEPVTPEAACDTDVWPYPATVMTVTGTVTYRTNDKGNRYWVLTNAVVSW